MVLEKKKSKNKLDKSSTNMKQKIWYVPSLYKCFLQQSDKITVAMISDIFWLQAKNKQLTVENVIFIIFSWQLHLNTHCFIVFFLSIR